MIGAKNELDELRVARRGHPDVSSDKLFHMPNLEEDWQQRIRREALEL